MTDGLGPEISPFSQWNVDVEEDTLLAEWTFDATIIDVVWIWSDLDFGTGITGASFDPSSTWGTLGSLSFTSDSVTYINDGGENTVSVGDYLLINIETSQVPLPASSLLLLGGLGAAAFFRRAAGRSTRG
ncbi:hypothetical protein RGUI_3332 [Rhodovulum sp. P5]|uniref:VPLPA-CTERM sorting domain-containing protein n=1 Tax=Rhodovulum sp. P5 TaxID=1564506 RepID=UPI0009C20A47|nr:VPLPA-CTERM sorting domain-containing protein [Rhodovulum sp. P5]ARE41473.1 hypothetical protein RGUI_3332 [Rhodovulum sp. P5]